MGDDQVNILIVEDDKKVALTITQLIERLGYQADAVETGEAAVKKVKENRFDLILLDIYLPDTDALQLIPRLEKICPKPKIVAMTGYDTADLEKKIRELGVLYYLSKPFTSHEFKMNASGTQLKEDVHSLREWWQKERLDKTDVEGQQEVAEPETAAEEVDEVELETS